MTAWWLTYAQGTRASECVEANTKEEASAVAVQAHGMEPVTVLCLPYPANPRLNKIEHEFSDGTKSACPSFCYSPSTCAGRGSCPHRYACSE
jgi:hypothetical protein